MWGSPIEIIRDTRLKRRLSISTQVSRPLHSHPQCADGRNLETDASNREGKGTPSLGSHSCLWCDLNCHHQEAEENPLARFSW